MRREVLRKIEACQVCGSFGKGVRLEVHHKTYDRLGHEKDEDLVVCCDACHPAEDKKRAQATAARNWYVRLDAWAQKKYGENWDFLIEPAEVEDQFSDWLESQDDS